MTSDSTWVWRKREIDELFNKTRLKLVPWQDLCSKGISCTHSTIFDKIGRCMGRGTKPKRWRQCRCCLQGLTIGCDRVRHWWWEWFIFFVGSSTHAGASPCRCAGARPSRPSGHLAFFTVTCTARWAIGEGFFAMMIILDGRYLTGVSFILRLGISGHWWLERMLIGK